MFKKNTAVTGFTFGLVNVTDGSPVTSGTTSGVVTLDGGTQAAIVGSFTHEGNGQWSVNLTAAEMNGDIVGLVFINSLAINTSFTISTYTQLDSNIVQINGATLPVDNIESQYDGTGIIGDNFPSTQSQVGNLAVGGGGISTIADAVSITNGNEAGTYTNTFAANGVYHILTPPAGTTDFYYSSNVGTSGVITAVDWEGYIQGNGDTTAVFGWDWVGSAWVQVDTLIGNNSITPQVKTFTLTNSMTGTGVNDGEIRIRFFSTTATTIATDRILFTYTIVQESGFIIHSGFAQSGSGNQIMLDVGASNIDGFYTNEGVIISSGTGTGQADIITDYDGTTKTATIKKGLDISLDTTSKVNIVFGQAHAATSAGGYDNGIIYIDGANGSAGVLPNVNGITTNPSSNFTDARTIADGQNIRKFSFSGGSFLALDQSYTDFVFNVIQGQVIDLNGQDVSGSVFMRSGITGVMTSSIRTVFEICAMINVTLDPCNMLQSGLKGLITLASSGRYQMWACWENGDLVVPVIDVNGDNITKRHLLMNDYSGRVIIKNLTAIDEIILSGNCYVTLDSTCSGGTITRMGDTKIVDNSTVSPTFVDAMTFETYDKTLTIDTKIDDVPTNAELNARTLLAASYFNAATDTVANVTTVATTTTNTDMRGTDNALLASNYTAPDNATINDTNVRVTSIQADYSTFNPATDTVANVTTVATTTVNTDMLTTAAIFAAGSIDGYSLDESLRLILSASAGKLSGAATSTVIIRDAADTKNRITATVDVDGNRISTTLDAS